MKYGIIGEVLKHTFSKTIHETLGGYEYGITELTKEKEEVNKSFTVNSFLTQENIFLKSPTKSSMFFAMILTFTFN